MRQEPQETPVRQELPVRPEERVRRVQLAARGLPEEPVRPDPKGRLALKARQASRVGLPDRLAVPAGGTSMPDRQGRMARLSREAFRREILSPSR